MNIETFNYNIESWVGEAMSKGMRRHQNVKCFNCGRIEHLKRNCRQGIPRNNVFSGKGKMNVNKLLDYAEGVAKTNIRPMNADQQRQTRQPDTIRKLLGGPLTGPPMSNMV